MTIRRAKTEDIPRVTALLEQVLAVHAEIRPDIFIPGTTKYTAEELEDIFRDDMRPVYVATDEAGTVQGYAFCVIQPPVPSNNMIPFTVLYIDDLCVDSHARGKGIGKALFHPVCAEAKRLGCRDITLNVWEGNDSAKAFYESMGMKVRKTVREIAV